MCPCQDPFYDNLTGCSAVYCGGSGGGGSSSGGSTGGSSGGMAATADVLGRALQHYTMQDLREYTVGKIRDENYYIPKDLFLECHPFG